MNEKVENLIKQEQECLDASKKQMRDNHLISLGLIDESKSARKYQDYYSESAKFDEEKQIYYKECDAALDVTDEEYEEICKYFSPIPPEKEISKTFSQKTFTIGIAILFFFYLISPLFWESYYFCGFILIAYLLFVIAINLIQINNKTK